MPLQKHAKVRDEKFGAVIFDTQREKVYVTNDVGKEILKLIRNGQTLEEIVQHFTNLYDEEPSTIKHDVISFLEDLRNSKLLT